MSAPAWIEERTIFVALAGSHAHGTARESSDVDLRGVCVAPLSVRVALFDVFEQTDATPPPGLWAKLDAGLQQRETVGQSTDDIDCILYDIAKFLRLLTAANPNALEILFVDDRDLLYLNDAGRRLREVRNCFLTRRVHQSYLGYAVAQLKRIKTHRSWLLDPPKAKPTRADYGLPESSTIAPDDQHRIEEALAEKIRGYGLNDLMMPQDVRIALEERHREFQREALHVSDEDLDERVRALATYGLRLPAEIVQALNAERKYRGAMKQWQSYMSWKRGRNKTRARLEREFGYDTKHASHLIRLMRTGLEIVETGELRVRRDDAEELTGIRAGKWGFEQLLEESNKLQARIQEASKRCTLPKSIDENWMEDLAREFTLADGEGRFAR